MNIRVWGLILVLVVGTGAAAGQPPNPELLAEIPSCALSCLLDAVAASNCSTEDTACVCQDNTLQANLLGCVQLSCNFTEAFKAGTISHELCAGIPIQTRSGEITGVSIVLMCITFPVAGMRFFSRLKFANRFYPDDWACVGASILLFTTAVIEILAAREGIGSHLWNILPADLPHLLQLFFITEVLYSSPLAFTKISLILFYLRIFQTRWFRIAAWTTICCVAISTTVTTCLAIFQCMPVQANWELGLKKRCLDTNAIAFTTSSINTSLDVVILLLPLPELRLLKMHWKKKAALIFMFLLGGFATATSLARLGFLVNFSKSKDPTFDNSPTIIWSALELNISLICACLPALRPLLGHYFSIVLGTTKAESAHHTTPHYRPRTWKRNPLPSGHDSELSRLSITYGAGKNFGSHTSESSQTARSIDGDNGNGNGDVICMSTYDTAKRDGDNKAGSTTSSSSAEPAKQSSSRSTAPLSQREIWDSKRSISRVQISVQELDSGRKAEETKPNKMEITKTTTFQMADGSVYTKRDDNDERRLSTDEESLEIRQGQNRRGVPSPTSRQAPPIRPPQSRSHKTTTPAVPAAQQPNSTSALPATGEQTTVQDIGWWKQKTGSFGAGVFSSGRKPPRV